MVRLERRTLTDLVQKSAEKFGKIGDLTAVCYASFNNKEEALEALKTIRNKESKEAWIFHY